MELEQKTWSSLKKNKNKLYFENLTLAPIEKDLINFNQLTRREKSYLFDYHLNVYLKISKFLNNNERKWLASLIQHLCPFYLSQRLNI